VSALLEVEGLSVEYAQGARRLRALDGVSFTLAAGEALAVVGESGCGKSTLGRAILQLVAASAGRVRFAGRELGALAPRELARLGGELTVVFQDPVASLDPRFTVGASVAEPLAVHEPTLGADARRRAVAAMLERVGLAAALAERHPHELSGGQCQRVAIARAMITRPRLVVCDEPLSALDVSVQAQIANLLDEFRREQGTALLFISHNLAVVRRLCTRVLVLYLGRTMELGPRAALFGAPGHPYTRLLLDSVPRRGQPPRLPPGGAGEPASPFSPPSGCVFRSRCRLAREACAGARPPLRELAPGHGSACILGADELAALAT
jgi:oligopeptide transport system ATP-binding protein